MLLLHTSDWHLGRDLSGFSRLANQKHCMERIVDTVREHRPDVLLVCGDVFDTPSPSITAQRLFWDTVQAVRRASPGITVIIIAGNHDSGSRLEAPHSVVADSAVHIVGTYSAAASDEDKIAKHIIAIPGCGTVVALPYANRRTLTPEAVDMLLQAAREVTPEGLPIVLTGHTTLLGVDYNGHDNATDHSVGGIDTIAPEQYGNGYDYLALGHIHKAQWVHGTGRRARYSGTPWTQSFDELRTHTVDLVRIAAHGAPPEVESVPIDESDVLVQIGYDSEITAAAMPGAIKDAGLRPGTFIRVRVTERDPLTALAQAAIQTAADQAGALLCKTERVSTDTGDIQTQHELDIDELRAISPVEMARMYLESINAPLTDDEQSLLDGLFEALGEEMRGNDL